MKMTKLVIFILIGCILTWPGTTISIRLNDFKFEYSSDIIYDKISELFNKK